MITDIVKTRRRGWTLIELLVTVGIVAVLIALTAPALRFVNDAARELKSLSYLRTHAQAMSSYTAGSQDAYPIFLEPTNLNVLDVGPGNLPLVRYFDAHWTWHIFLGREGHALPYDAEIYRSPRSIEAHAPLSPYRTDYAYPCVFVAKPSFWKQETRVFGTSQYGVTRSGDVAYASSKALVVEMWPFVDDAASSAARRSLLVAMVDGSASGVSRGDLRRGYPKGDGAEFLRFGAVHFNDDPPALHTVDGVHGRDTKR